MLTYPQTKQEAEAYRYGDWAGNPKGYKYDPQRCAFEVFPQERGSMHHQCLRNPGHGPDGLYCKTHAKRVTK